MTGFGRFVSGRTPSLQAVKESGSREVSLPQSNLWIIAALLAGGALLSCGDFQGGIQMRFASIAALLLAIAPVQAAVVTFEELEPVPFGSAEEFPSVTSGGFTFSVEAYFDQFLSASALGDEGGNAPTGNYFWAGAYPDSCCMSMDITRDDGAAFDLSSIDLFGAANGDGLTVQGYDALGQLIATSVVAPTGFDSNGMVISDGWRTAVFGDEWNSVSKVIITESFGFCGACNGFDQSSGIGVDNFAATVVPIPAAVWLFGSALAGLGWFRRKTALQQAAND